MTNRNQQSFLQVSLSSIIAPKQKNRTLAHWNSTERWSYKSSKIKIHKSKIPSNLDLPHSLVFILLFSSMNFCVGDIKHIKTTANKLDLERIVRTRWALFCISPQSPPRKLSILIAISKPCSPFIAVCEETSTVTPGFFPGIC